MAASSETVAVAAAQSSWLAGALAVLAETNSLFEKSPTIGFAAMGVLGAFAGWALMIETGKWDARSTGQQVKSLLLRIGIGLVIGVGVGVYWADQTGASRGIWMLLAGAFAAAPIDVSRIGLDMLQQFLRSRQTKDQGK